MPSIDLTGHFPNAGETFATGTVRKHRTRKNGTKIYTFVDKKGDNADGVTHHLIQRPNGKYALKVDDGDHRHDKDDVVIGRGRTPLKAGGSTKGRTTFGLIQNDQGNCVFFCFGNDGGMEGSDRRSSRTIESLNDESHIITIQHGNDAPFLLNPWGICDNPNLPVGGHDSYSESIAHHFDNCWA